MSEFYVTIMSIDPHDHYGKEQGDNHQKYGYSVDATNRTEAQKKGVTMFKEENGNLPILSIRVE
jgi:hypothetical protein